MQAIGHQNQPRRLEPARDDCAQRELGADVVAGEQRSRAGHLPAEARRSPPRASRACRGAAAGPRNLHAAEGREARPGSARTAARRPAPTRGARGRASAAARSPAGPRLAVGDPGAVVVVVEPQSHANASSHSDSSDRDLRSRKAVQMLSRPSRTLPKRLKCQPWSKSMTAPSVCRRPRRRVRSASRSAPIRRWSDMGYLKSYRTPGGQRRFSHEQIDSSSTRFSAAASGRTSASTRRSARTRSGLAPASRGRRRRGLPAGPRLFDPPLHVELGVEVGRVRVPVLDALAAQQLGEHLDVARVELRCPRLGAARAAPRTSSSACGTCRSRSACRRPRRPR